MRRLVMGTEGYKSGFASDEGVSVKIGSMEYPHGIRFGLDRAASRLHFSTAAASASRCPSCETVLRLSNTSTH